jgi:hypothetical protein
MPLVKLSIKDRFGSLVLGKTYMCNDIESAANKFKVKYPQYWVSLNEVDTKGESIGTTFFHMCPLDMRIDEVKLNNELITFEEYREYWYPDKKQVKAALDKELSKAEQEMLAEQESIDDQYNPFSDIYEEED